MDVDNGHEDEEDGSESVAVDWFAKGKIWTKKELEPLAKDPDRFKCYAWARLYSSQVPRHHRIYRKVYVDGLYTSMVKCMICNDYVNYNMRTGTSYMLRHIKDKHSDVDFNSLPPPKDDECEPKPKQRVKISTLATPSTKSRRKNRYRTSYMDEIDDEDRGSIDEDVPDDDDDDKNKAIKLLTELLTKEGQSKQYNQKPIEEYSDAEMNREMKVIGLKKARAELHEVEIRVKEREAKIAFYNEAKNKIGLIASRMLIKNQTNDQSIIGNQQVNDLHEAFNQLVGEH